MTEMTPVEQARVEQFHGAALGSVLGSMMTDPNLAGAEAGASLVQRMESLQQWWLLVDDLAGDLVEASPAAQHVVDEEIGRWFTARQRLLVWIAHRAGYDVPCPDALAGVVATSTRVVGHFGYQGDR